MQVIEALKRAQEEEIIFSQTGMLPALADPCAFMPALCSQCDVGFHFTGTDCCLMQRNARHSSHTRQWFCWHSTNSLHSLHREGFARMRLPGADSEVDPVPARQQGRAQAEQAAASANGRDDAEEAEEGEEEEEELEEEELKIVLKIKSSFHTDGLKLRIGVEQPFKKLFKVYEDQGHKAGWLPKGARVVFKFDGEPLGGGDTAKHLDMEDEDVIDACW